MMIRRADQRALRAYSGPVLMSYSLELYFKPAVRRVRIIEHFAARKNYTIEKDNIQYNNLDTGVYFFVRLRCARNILLDRGVVSAEFEVNYHRPSYFGVEAELELSALVAAFRPQIDDPQINGMGQGNYSRGGFLNGWTFGNVFSVRGALSRTSDLDIPSMPAAELRAAWEWNYNLAGRRDRLGHRCVLPRIMFLRREGRPCRVVVWPRGLPILLPQVDFVLVGRLVSGEMRVGLAPHSEVLDVAGRAGFDTTADPLDIEFFVTPPPIANWVSNITLIDLATLERLQPDQVLDDELVAAARESHL